MDTKVFLVRHGITDWHREGKLLGQRDIALNEEGLAQAERAADGLSHLEIAEVISSPLLRALQTAEIIGKRSGIEIARDPRLLDFRVGKWEGMTYEQISASEEYQRFLADPFSERIPGGESLQEVITHAGVIRVLLTHYIGSPPANYHRIRVSPGSVSVLSFAGDNQPPRVLSVNWCHELEVTTT